MKENSERFKSSLNLAQRLIQALQKNDKKKIERLLDKNAHYGFFVIKIKSNEKINEKNQTYESCYKMIENELQSQGVFISNKTKKKTKKKKNDTYSLYLDTIDCVDTDRYAAEFYQCVLFLLNESLFFLDRNNKSLHPIESDEKNKKYKEALKKKFSDKVQFKSAPSETMQLLNTLAPKLQPILHQPPYQRPFLCYTRDLDVIQLLLNKGINPKIGNFETPYTHIYSLSRPRNTVLHYYISTGYQQESSGNFFNQEFFTLLIQYGVDLSSKNSDNLTALEMFCIEKKLNATPIYFLLQKHSDPITIASILLREFLHESVSSCSSSTLPRLGLMALLIQHNLSQKHIAKCLQTMNRFDFQKEIEKIEKNSILKLLFCFILCHANCHGWNIKNPSNGFEKIIAHLNASEDNKRKITVALEQKIMSLSENKNNLKKDDRSDDDELLLMPSKIAVSFFCSTKRREANKTLPKLPRPVKMMILDKLVFLRQTMLVNKLNRLNSEAIDIAHNHLMTFIK